MSYQQLNKICQAVSYVPPQPDLQMRQEIPESLSDKGFKNWWHYNALILITPHRYHLDYLMNQLEQVYPQIMTKIWFELSTKPSKQAKAERGKSGFVPAIARWVLDRSNAWMERCKVLVKNFERTLSIATTKLNLCLIRLMIKQLAASP